MAIDEEYLPYDELKRDLELLRFAKYHDPTYVHTFTFWAIWHDDDFGSNQAVFHSIGELCDWILDCGGFPADDLLIVEETSGVKR